MPVGGSGGHPPVRVGAARQQQAYHALFPVGGSSGQTLARVGAELQQGLGVRQATFRSGHRQPHIGGSPGSSNNLTFLL